ncbi:signal peptide-containing protein [Theileria equi strain WA]|uniref:Signal peptide-containing protein n=1 Tax=Theileria equi strain WA TaxID=1537102 RepID=L0B0Z5_THEEQ|nr:signal peptide-containing protein [Theileria equi strain WA]AFZ80896.1 signal peptide-containing protein [Theileria equi strain WA]|eukprot:XP_004830562.1 signal peptide-containing protein [Theileria equi strain WA]
MKILVGFCAFLALKFGYCAGTLKTYRGIDSYVYEFHNEAYFEEGDFYGKVIDGEFERISKTAPVRPPAPITLNICDPDAESLDINTSDCEYGVTIQKFSPEHGFVIKSVVDSHRKVWEAFGDEKCLYVLLMTSYTSDIITLEIESEGKLDPIYFSREYGRWRSITEEGFNERFRRMGELSSLNKYL